MTFFVNFMGKIGTMRKIIFFCLATFTALSLLTSCKDDTSGGTDVNIYKVPADIAVRYLALAFSNATTGINFHMENLAKSAAAGSGNFDTTFVLKKSDTSAVVKYQYIVDYQYTNLTSQPHSADLEYSANGNFSASNLLSIDRPDGSWIISGLDQSRMTLTGTGSITGEESAITEKVTFSSMVNYTFHNVMMNKVTFKADTGSATVNIHGSGPGYVDFAYSGTLSFNGNRKATLVLSGTTYDLNLDTGNYSKK